MITALSILGFGMLATFFTISCLVLCVCMYFRAQMFAELEAADQHRCSIATTSSGRRYSCRINQDIPDLSSDENGLDSQDESIYGRTTIYKQDGSWAGVHGEHWNPVKKPIIPIETEVSVDKCSLDLASTTAVLSKSFSEDKEIFV